MNIKHRFRKCLAALALAMIGVTASAAHAGPATPLDTNVPVDAKPIRVACVGDSITAGAGVANPGFQSYPAQLQRMLGNGWIVGNFGNSGATLLNKGDKPYQKQNSFHEALKFQPDTVIIMLGTNDTKPQNWNLKAQFTADYKDLIRQFRQLESKPRIILCRPPLIAGQGNWGIDETRMQEELPLIDAIGKEENTSVIDIHSVFAGKEKLLPDRVHPNAEGATLIGKAAFQELTGKPFEGEPPTVDHSSWNGYSRQDFLVANRACILVAPKKPLPGAPWIWRTEFFGVFPSADIALLEKGFHLAYINVQNLFGSPRSMSPMEEFYEHVTKTYGLAPKVVLEGFSRGGLYAFNWAALHPDKVACLYVDAPVCDFKSWPGGKGKGDGSPKDWEICKKAYNLTEEQALAYGLNPVDNLQPIATAKIPIIAVAGDADTTVPMDENILVVEKRYRELGGEIKVIVKPGIGHHPHSLADPKPILDFILAH